MSKVDQGDIAVKQARHEILDAAVLISTGPDMDLVETALNLRDINPSIVIIFIADRRSHERADPMDAIAHAIPRAKVLTAMELGQYLDSAEWHV